MAMRIRIVNNKTVVLCAAQSDPKDGDIYLNDVIDHAIREKLVKDFISEGLINDDIKMKNIFDNIHSGCNSGILKAQEKFYKEFNES